ncbi:uncharacterized protein LOC133626777 [Colius striatus]|uniref:uncharacterized protein LOC133626777 n=1 Tax=Colius striatus TaxID=57412 RepID=UPI002B1E8F2E|nr:uncharacterized protein LOC133626777 [Colius striatus]
MGESESFYANIINMNNGSETAQTQAKKGNNPVVCEGLSGSAREQEPGCGARAAAPHQPQAGPQLQVEASATTCRRVGGCAGASQHAAVEPEAPRVCVYMCAGGGSALHSLSGSGGGRAAMGGCGGVGRAARRERAPPSRARAPVLHGAAQPALQRELESRSAPRSASHSAAHASAARRRPAAAGHAAAAAAIALRSAAGQTGPAEAPGQREPGRALQRSGSKSRFVLPCSSLPALTEGCFPAPIPLQPRCSLPQKVLSCCRHGARLWQGKEDTHRAVCASWDPPPPSLAACSVMRCFGSSTVLCAPQGRWKKAKVSSEHDNEYPMRPSPQLLPPACCADP